MSSAGLLAEGRLQLSSWRPTFGFESPLHVACCSLCCVEPVEADGATTYQSIRLITLVVWAAVCNRETVDYSSFRCTHGGDVNTAP